MVPVRARGGEGDQELCVLGVTKRCGFCFRLSVKSVKLNFTPTSSHHSAQ